MQNPVADPEPPAVDAVDPAEPAAPAPRACGLDVNAWPIERLVVLLAGGVTLLTLALGRAHHPRWRLMTGFIASNLVAQATIGWCPASLLMRRLGFRRAIDRPGI